ncbi:MAG: phosphoglycerate kinase [Anaerolineaceae bacterium]|nr:phosphoglycerate kinase [Anaerolineaceae bacterium]
MIKKTVRDADVEGKRVLVRVDFNVPLEDGRVTDDTRIRAALPTIRYLLDRDAVVILASHLGRPKGKVDEQYRMAPIADRLSELLDRPVIKLNDCVGPEVQEAVRQAKPGDVLMLENTRFHAEETDNEASFARELASLAELYVNDAFGSAHRAHASTEGVAHHLPAVAGFLMEKELEFLGRALSSPERPFIAILGGAKISDKIGVIENLLDKVDAILIGGGMANTFLRADGYDVAESLVEEESVDTARDLIRRGGDRIVLPVDVVVADRFDADAFSQVVTVGSVPPGWRILDVGTRTLELFKEELDGAKTVVWNGPMGVFEFPKFAYGTEAVARMLAALPDATTIIGGGDSAAAVERSGLAGEMTHISTGGGASLEFLEGKTLPGVAALQDR